MPDIDNADQIFEQEPDDRSDSQKILDEMLEDCPDGLKGYLKGLAKMTVPEFMPASRFSSPILENTAVLLSLRNLDDANKSVKTLSDLIEAGWMYPGYQLLQYEGFFLVVLSRPRPNPAGDPASGISPNAG